MQTLFPNDSQVEYKTVKRVDMKSLSFPSKRVSKEIHSLFSIRDITNRVNEIVTCHNIEDYLNDINWNRTEFTFSCELALFYRRSLP